MIKKFDTYINESLKGKLKGKSKEEIKKLFGTQSDGSVLAKCAIYGFLDIIKEFFEENGIDHVKLDSLLVFASDHGHLDIVKYLIDKGAHIKYSVSGSSAVHASIQNRHYDVTKYLLSNTDFRVKDDKLLAFSVHMNRHEAVEILLDYFKYPLETLKKQIGMAKSQQDDQMVKILKDYRKINYPSNYAKLRKYLNLDESLTDKIIGKSNDEMESMLSNLSGPDYFLEVIRIGYLPGLIKFLSGDLSSISIDPDLYINQALKTSVAYGHIHVIKYLIDNYERSIDMVAHGSMLLSPFASKGDLDTVKELLDKGANPNDGNCEVLKHAMYGQVKDINIVKLLLEYKPPVKDIKKIFKEATNTGWKTTNDILNLVYDYVDDNTRPFFSFLRENIEYKKVSNSLFWNFVKRMTDLDTKFELNTIHIKDVNNSLDTDDYILFLETSELNTDAVRYELKYSSALSNILNYLDDKVNNKVSFYVGFKMNSELHFGFIFDDKKYKIGYIYYQSSDFFKLRNLITKTNKEINLLDLSKRFKSKISTMVAINTLVTKYLSKYEDITIYNSVVDEGFCILIECKDNDILNKNYLDKIIESNVKLSRVEYTIEQEKRNNKTIYYIIIK